MSEGFKVEETSNPPCFRIVKESNETNEVEEVVFLVHGVILSKKLPPLKKET